MGDDLYGWPCSRGGTPLALLWHQLFGITMQENFRLKNRPFLKNPRTRAFHAQGGRCYYCKQPMWAESPDELTSQYSITRKQARLLQCTGEHLEPHSMGGSARADNIVAACRYCNEQRHRRKTVPSPGDFCTFVISRLAKDRWHGLTLSA